MIVGVLQARMSSSRLPGKVLKPILGKPMLALQIERVRRATLLDHLVVATSTNGEDDGIAALCTELGLTCHRGSLHDVLDRCYQAVVSYRPDYVVRLTGDCPLADWTIIDRVIDFCIEGGFDYAGISVKPTFPQGLDAEVAPFVRFEEAWREAEMPSEREHVMPFLHRRPERFRIGHLTQGEDLSALRWTVDQPADFVLVETIYGELYPTNPAFTTADILALIKRRPELATINAGFTRADGLKPSEVADTAFLAARAAARQ